MIDHDYILILTAAGKKRTKTIIKEEILAEIEEKVDAAMVRCAESGANRAHVSWDVSWFDSYGILVREVAKKYTAAPGGYRVELSCYQPNKNEDDRIMMEISW